MEYIITILKKWISSSDQKDIHLWGSFGGFAEQGNIIISPPPPWEALEALIYSYAIKVLGKNINIIIFILCYFLFTDVFRFWNWNTLLHK